MVSKKSRQEVRLNKHRKLRNRFSGTAERPRLAAVSYTHLDVYKRQDIMYPARNWRISLMQRLHLSAS